MKLDCRRRLRDSISVSRLASEPRLVVIDLRQPASLVSSHARRAPVRMRGTAPDEIENQRQRRIHRA
jgi:hypothetical protein